MPQTRICAYYETCCGRRHITPSPTSFINLPEDLRDRIYNEAGLISGVSLRMIRHSNLPQERKDWRFLHYAAVLDIGGSAGKPFLAVTEEDEPFGADPQAYFNLSLSNRDVRADVARYICTHNEILLCCGEHTDLGLLHQIPQHLMTALRHLTIHIDIAAQHETHCRDFGSCCHRHPEGFAHSEDHDRRLDSTTQIFALFVDTWRLAISHLASFADATRLSLRLYSNIEDCSAARQIVQTVTQAGLTFCTVRLGHKPSTSLKSIAVQAAKSHTDIKSHPFRFLDLPPELRQHILSFTDLVTPLRKICVEGRRFSVFKSETGYDYDCENLEFCSMYQYDSPRSHCSDIPQYPGCDCWMPPTPLFMVCKEMLHDTRRLFFANNHFVVLLNHSTVVRERQFEGSFFLRYVIPRDSLFSLRSLELVFPARLYDFFGPDDLSGIDTAIYKDWKETIDYAASRITRLELRLNMGAFDYSDRTVLNGIAQPSEERLLHTYVHIVRPLQRLRCIELFSVWVHSPVEHGNQIKDTAKLREHEKHLETLVMGEKYDKMAQEKGQLLEDERWVYPGLHSFLEAGVRTV